jgi:(p)ppGpp synthase/HD superfamily hydrolase
MTLQRKTPVETAIEWAAKAHKNQYRKGTDMPYVSHPYAVGMMLAQAGCEEEVIIAAILHDTVEDTEVTLEDIRNQFGSRVAVIVEGCSEPDKELPWEERKQHTLDYLRTAPIEVCMVACADKLHNVRSMLVEYQEQGERTWERFNRGREKQAWYYRGLVKSLEHQLENQKFYLEFKSYVEKLFS